MMDDEKDYEDMFHRDDRNKRGTGLAKKRTNVREVRKRITQMEKREGLGSNDTDEDPLP